MATISKFYLHDAATTNTGIMPGAGDAFHEAQHAGVSADVTGDATGARTARLTDDTIGALQTSALVTSTANTSQQQWGYRRFVTAPLAAHSFTSSDGNWTFSYARAESNLLHNQSVALCIYPWRPSTGAVVGSGFMVKSGVEPTVAATEQTESFVVSGWITADPTISDGDILVFELSDDFIQGMNTSYTSNFYYDGTTEASTTSCASFVTPPSALTLFTPAINIPGPTQALTVT